MKQIKEKIEEQLKLEKEILKLLTEEKLIAFVKGSIVSLESVLREIENGNKKTRVK